MKNHIRVLEHSSIRIEGSAGVIYTDPFRIKDEAHDADFIFVTHDHYDHFVPEDIAKISKGPETTLVVPLNMKETAQAAKDLVGKIVTVQPGDQTEIGGIPVEAVPSYNVNKKFHPKEAGWVGYIYTIDGERIYIAGDTDINEDVLKVQCDVALVPVGGTFTTTAGEAAELVNSIRPETAIPTHYGSIVGKPGDADVFAEKVDDSIKVEILMENFQEGE